MQTCSNWAIGEVPWWILNNLMHLEDDLDCSKWIFRRFPDFRPFLGVAWVNTASFRDMLRGHSAGSCLSSFSITWPFLARNWAKNGSLWGQDVVISDQFWAGFFWDKFSGPHWDHLALWCFYALLWKSRWPLGGFPLFLAFFSPFCPFIFRHIFRPHKRHFGTKMVSFCGVISRSFLDHFGII